MRPRLAAGLPFAPKHWQIHHRPYIDRPPETLIPEIRVPYSEKFVRWTRVQALAPKTDESVALKQTMNRKTVLRRSPAEALVVGEEGTKLLSNREGGGKVQCIQGPQCRR